MLLTDPRMETFSKSQSTRRAKGPMAVAYPTHSFGRDDELPYQNMKISAHKP